MHIVFLSHYFPPEVNAPATRTYEHCKEWIRNGHQVTVVTCVPNHPRGKIYPGYKNRLYQVEEKDGIKVVRLWTYVTANEGFLKRTLNYISYKISAILATPFIGKADVVVSTSPQFFNGLAGYVVSRLKGAPWILEIRDLWPESILTVGAINNKQVIRFLEWLEMFAYRKADRIVPVTNAFKDYMVAKGIAEDKIHVIKNGVDLSFYDPVLVSNPLTRELEVDNKFVVSYFGTHGMAHNLETILYAADQLRDYRDIVFMMVGDGAERKKLLQLRDEMQLDNVIMLEQQPKQQMPYLWQLSNVSLVLLKKSRLFKTVIPSKIFESMAMQKPVILGVEGESSEIINDANAGFTIEPENDGELAEKVLRLYNDSELCHMMGKNGRSHVTEFYDRSVLARRFESVMASV
ncbi:MAG: glycosyltransferase family 4 protein [Gammaproteobacteria bacterium]|jgi:glycosyltransferase involved in cell wall biosynthesis